MTQHSLAYIGYGLSTKYIESISIVRLLKMAALVFFSATTHAAQKPTSGEVLQARNYVLAACIMDRYAGTPLSTEADAWASGLVENGSLPADAYPALALLAKSAPKPGITQNGITMRMQSCIDFINSRSLLKRVKRALRHYKE
jgi:hypothetical protein